MRFHTARAYTVCLGLLAACIPDMGAPLVEPSDAAPLPDANPATPDAGTPDGSTLIAEGQTVYFTAQVDPYGAVGCAYCHCEDAMGGCQFLAPKIIGKSRASIADALDTINEMSAVQITEHEIEAVAAYLASLVPQ